MQTRTIAVIALICAIGAVFLAFPRHYLKELSYFVETGFSWESARLCNIVNSNAPERWHHFSESHQDLCRTVCGVRYDSVDIRDFFQTPSGHLGVTCIDASNDEMKNSVSFSDDRAKKHNCFGEHTAKGKGFGTETHRERTGRWCVKYNYSLCDVPLGAYVQCVGKI